MGIGHTDRAAGFTAATDRQTIAADGYIRCRSGAGNVRCVECHRRRLRAEAIERNHAEHFAVGLRRAKRHRKGAVSADRRTSEHVAIGRTHFNRGAGPGGTAELAAVTAQTEVRGCLRFDNLRSADRCARGNIASRIDGIDGQ